MKILKILYLSNQRVKRGKIFHLYFKIPGTYNPDFVRFQRLLRLFSQLAQKWHLLKSSKCCMISKGYPIYLSTRNSPHGSFNDRNYIFSLLLSTMYILTSEFSCSFWGWRWAAGADNTQLTIFYLPVC